MSVMLYPCILCVVLLKDRFIFCVSCLTVFVNCLVKQFAICLSVVVILLLNVMEVFSDVKVLCWIDRAWSCNECACSACESGVHLIVPSIGFVYVLVCRKLFPHLTV